jgi:hypothetical protein
MLGILTVNEHKYAKAIKNAATPVMNETFNSSFIYLLVKMQEQDNLPSDQGRLQWYQKSGKKSRL